MVCFRVSEDEYEWLRRNTASEGARSVSEYARKLLCRMAQCERDAGNSRIEEIDRRMHALTLTVQRLWEALDDRGGEREASGRL